MYQFTIDGDTRVVLGCARESAYFREWLESKEVDFSVKGVAGLPIRPDSERVRVACVMQQYFEEKRK